MADKVEERLRDLEALVVRQAERIEALEDMVQSLGRLSYRVALDRAALARLREPEDEAA